MAEYTQEQQWRILLASTDKLTWRTKRMLLTHFGSAEGIFECLQEGVAQLVSPGAYEALTALKRGGADPVLAQMERVKACAVFVEGEDYPALLKQIPDPPDLLFVRGIPRPDTRSVAVVGSRHDTRYGRSQAWGISRELAQQGVSVVSGLARGIDTAAHEGALAGKGRTVAVLGSGVDVIYPPENSRLAEAMLQSGGAIVSEFPMGAEPSAYHFPVRNRIISGICAATLLVEGSKKSGTMITAGYAADQGREVYALPGMVDAPGSVAPLRLLREGANVCTCAADILQDLHWSGAAVPGEDVEEKIKNKLRTLSGEERLIAEMLAGEEMHLQTLIEKTGIPVERLSALLSTLELDGVIESRPGRAWALAL